MNSPKPLYKFLNAKNDRAASLITKAKFMGKLNLEFLKNVPAPINLHVKLAHVHGSKLHVIADTPAWATKFRFMSAHLIPTLRKNVQYFQYVKEISVSTRPLRKLTKNIKKVKTRGISFTAKVCLENMAESLEKGGLQESLLRLANNHKQKQ